jgi:hypothetical protein
MKILLFIFSIISSSNLFAQGEFRAYVMDSQKRLNLGETCRSSLQSHYNNGYDLKIEAIHKRAIALKDLEKSRESYRYEKYERKGMKNNFFYHHFYWDDVRKGRKKTTPNAEILLNEGFERSTEDLVIPTLLPFEFRRKERNAFLNLSTTWENNSTNSVLYVAGDPYSSSYHGDTLITFDFIPESRIYFLTTATEYVETQKIVKYYIENTFHKLALDCQRELNTVTGNFLFLVFEDSKIDLIQYFKKTAWFHVINTDNIRSTTLTKIYEGNPKSKSSGKDIHKKINRKVKKALRINNRQSEIL